MVIIIRGSPDKLQPYKGSIQAQKYKNIKYKIQKYNFIPIQFKHNNTKYKTSNKLKTIIDGYNHPA